MAHVDNNIITGKLRGSLGRQLVFRVWDDRTIVSKSPRRRSTARSKAEKATQERFVTASRYARSVLKSADQGLAQAYAANLKPRQNVYSRALQDFMSKPVVNSINTVKYKGAPADILAIKATDDFRVTGVYVEIYSANGALLESGKAIQNLNGPDWTYRVKQSNSELSGSRIKAIATDIPGNEGTMEITI